MTSSSSTSSRSSSPATSRSLRTSPSCSATQYYPWGTIETMEKDLFTSPYDSLETSQFWRISANFSKFLNFRGWRHAPRKCYVFPPLIGTTIIRLFQCYRCDTCMEISKWVLKMTTALPRSSCKNFSLIGAVAQKLWPKNHLSVSRYIYIYIYI